MVVEILLEILKVAGPKQTDDMMDNRRKLMDLGGGGATLNVRNTTKASKDKKKCC